MKKKWTVYIFFLGSSGRLALETLSRQFINCIRQFLLLVKMDRNHFWISIILTPSASKNVCPMEIRVQIKSVSWLWHIIIITLEIKTFVLVLEFEMWRCGMNQTLSAKNNHAHVTTQRILNKFIEINFSVGCMVWPWWCLFQHELPVKFW